MSNKPSQHFRRQSHHFTEIQSIGPARILACRGSFSMMTNEYAPLEPTRHLQTLSTAPTGYWLLLTTLSFNKTMYQQQRSFLNWTICISEYPWGNWVSTTSKNGQQESAPSSIEQNVFGIQVFVIKPWNVSLGQQQRWCEEGSSRSER